MKFVTIFVLCLLFSCAGPEIRTSEDQPSESAQTDAEISDLEERFSIVPFQSKTLAFSGIPVAIPVQIVPDDPTNWPEYPFPATCRLTTSDGKVVQASIRWLRTVPRSVFVDPPAGEDLTTTGENTDSTDRKRPALRTRPVFPWVEPDIRLVGAVAPTSRNELNERFAFLVVQDGGLLPDGLVRVDESTFSVEQERAVLNSGSGTTFDRVPGDRDWWAQPDLTFPLEAFRRDLLSSPIQSSRLESDPIANSRESEKAADVDDEFLLLSDVLNQQTRARFRFGLSRLTSISPGVASTVIEDLTRTCRDGRFEFAAWRAGADELAELEERMLSRPWPGREADWAAAVLAWAEEDQLARAWIESAQGHHIRIAVANLSRLNESFRLQWDPASDIETEGVSFDIPARTVMRMSIPRRVRRTGLAAPPLFLMYGDDVIQQFNIPPATILVVPPGAHAGPAWRMWQLDSWMRSEPRLAPESQQSNATIRLYEGRWQLVIECRCDSDTGNWLDSIDDSDDQSERPGDEVILAQMLGMEHLAGIEAMTLFVGDYLNPAMVMTITPMGEVRVWRSAPTTNTLLTVDDDIEVRRQPSKDRWLVTINIPDAWIDWEQGQALEIGFVRTHRGSPYGDCFPYPCLPWRINPGRVRYDLTHWSP